MTTARPAPSTEPTMTEAPTTTVSPVTTGSPVTTHATEPERAGAEGALDFELDSDPGSNPEVFGYAALTEVDDAALIDDVTEALGGSDADTGWIPMPEAYACTGASEYRSLLWDDIRYVLTRYDSAPQTTVLAAWTIGDTALEYSPPLDTGITEPSGITTDDGIGLGTSADQLANLDWDQSLLEHGRFLGLAGSGPVVFELDATNQVVAMSYEQNDC